MIRAAAANLVVRTLTITAFAISAAAHFGLGTEHRPFAAIPVRWDGAYYAAIAVNGYPHSLPMASDTVAPSPAAFFPLFPLLARAIMTLGLPFWFAALALATVCSTVAAALIALVVRRYANERVALITAVIWTSLPMAGVLSAAYSEALFTMLAAGCLLALLDERWIGAGLFALLAGATRPTGAVLSLVCLVAAIIAIKRRRDLRSLISVALAPLGVFASWAWIGANAGRWDAWFVTESQGWGAHVDGGLDTLRALRNGLDGYGGLDHGAMRAELVIALLVLVGIAVYQRPPAIITSYLIGSAFAAVASAGTYASIPRFLLPVFPLLVPLALLLDRLGTRITMAALSTLAISSVVIGAWIFTVAPFAP